MEKCEAQAIMKEATRNIDWYNLVGVMFHLGELEHPWGRHNNDQWLPDYNKAWEDHFWFRDNAIKISEALECLKKVGKKDA